MRVAVDTGGTFTDLIFERQDGRSGMHKAPSTPSEPLIGVLDAVDLAAEELGMDRRRFLGETRLFIHATTRATNAVLTRETARTGLIVTKGHRDILVFREGRRTEPFAVSRPYPKPYVARALTLEVSERVNAAGEVVTPLNEREAEEVIQRLVSLGVEAIGVCLLWSVVNPSHELRVGELLDSYQARLEYTLSHQLNPSIREYRRASSTVIDASLKPNMRSYFAGLRKGLFGAGFDGRLLVVTSDGGLVDSEFVEAKPIYSINSGPSMAPVAGREYAAADVDSENAIVADTGGTSYDVSLVRKGTIPRTRETWLGEEYFGNITGFPSVDVKSIGAGGGSIAWVDDAGLLHVGPHSAGARPGPACYGAGGTDPTVTDAAVLLGIIDEDFFLGGRMPLHRESAKEAIQEKVAERLGVGVYKSAAGIMRVATESMATAIETITLRRGVDPNNAVLIAGGGAGGLNAIDLARRLRIPRVIVPRVSPALSAAGALISDMVGQYGSTCLTTSASLDYELVGRTLAELRRQCQAFLEVAETLALDHQIRFTAEARYPEQVWELEVALERGKLESAEDVRRLLEVFHREHESVYGFADRDSEIEIVGLHGRIEVRVRPDHWIVPIPEGLSRPRHLRQVYFPRYDWLETVVVNAGNLPMGEAIKGPIVVEDELTTVVVDPSAAVKLQNTGSLILYPSVGDIAEDVPRRSSVELLT